jgi:hypothetical protein
MGHQVGHPDYTDICSRVVATHILKVSYPFRRSTSAFIFVVYWPYALHLYSEKHTSIRILIKEGLQYIYVSSDPGRFPFW